MLRSERPIQQCMLINFVQGDGFLRSIRPVNKCMRGMIAFLRDFIIVLALPPAQTLVPSRW